MYKAKIYAENLESEYLEIEISSFEERINFKVPGVFDYGGEIGGKNRISLHLPVELISNNNFKNIVFPLDGKTIQKIAIYKDDKNILNYTNYNCCVGGFVTLTENDKDDFSAIINFIQNEKGKD